MHLIRRTEGRWLAPYCGNIIIIILAMYFMFFAPVNIVSAFHNDIVVVTRKRELSFYICLIIHCTRSKCLQPHPLHAHLCQIQERSLKLAILWIWKVWALVSNSEYLTHAQGIHSCIYILLHLSLQKKESCLQLHLGERCLVCTAQITDWVRSYWKVHLLHLLLRLKCSVYCCINYSFTCLLEPRC